MMAIRVREDEHFSPEMTPLIDVVFLLLVFFLVATTFHKMEREMSVSVPSSETGKSAGGGADPVVVNVLEDGRIVVDGVTVDLGQLQSILSRQRERSDDAIKALIRADRRISVEALVSVADACRKARATIALATLNQGESG